MSLPPLLTATQQAAARRLDSRRLPDVCTIIHFVREDDESGGSLVSEVVHENVPCWRQANLAGNTEQMFGGQLQSGLQWLFIVPYGIDVHNEDEVIYGEERFAVLGVLGPRSHELVRRFIAVEKGAETGDYA